MTRSRSSWPHALRALGLACALVSAVMFAASNFVLVDIRLGGATLETRLAWAVLVPAALGFAGGMVYRRRCGRASAPHSTQSTATGRPAGEHP